MFKNRFILIIVFLVVLVFGNTLFNSYVWDDHTFVKNQNHSKFPPISVILDGSYPVPNSGTYRPVRNLLYAISITTFNNDPFLHHLLVVSIHMACSVLVYVMLKQIFGDNLATKVGAILFSVHPIHTENINWITAGYDMFFVITYLLAIVFHIKARRNETKSWVPYIFTALAFFTNELALTLPLVMMAIDGYVFRLSLKDVGQRRTYMQYLVLIFFYLTVRMKYIADSPYETVVYENLLQRFILALILFGTYIWQLFYPLNLTADHYFQPGLTGIYNQNHNLTHPPPVLQFENPNIFIPLVISVVWMVITAISWRKKLKIILSLLWIPISLVLVLRIVPLPIIYAERYAYLASIGYIILVVTILMAIKKSKYFKLVTLGILAQITIFSFVSYNRNKDWQNEYTLWSHTLKNNPESAAANGGLGIYYYLIGDYEKSHIYHEKSALTNPYFYHFQINYIASLFRFQKYEEIIEFINLAVKVNSDSIPLYTSLASTYDEMGDYQNAMKNYQKAYDLSVPGSSIRKEIEDLVDKLDDKYGVVELK